MLLAVDIGNSNVTLGAFDGKHLLNQWRLASDPEKTADEYGSAVQNLLARALPKRSVRAFVYGSVVPRLDAIFSALALRYFGLKAIAVTVESPLGIRLRVDRPSEVGIDRLLNSLAVSRLYGTPAVVLDFGTATTLDCVSASDEYLGGAILIGPGTAARALAEKTAKLPEVQIRPTRRVIGKNTVECIQAGLYDGYLGMMERILKKTIQEMRPYSKGRKLRLIATGGWAELFARELGVPILAPDLTLQGLRLAYETIS
jgi:type III pantothenate kinase